MPLERISAEEVRARPGAIQELAVRLTDDDENPISKKSVTFTVTPPGAVLFNGAQYAAVETDAHGIVSVRALINEVGRHTVHVKAPPGDRHHKTQFTVLGTSDTEVVPMGDDVLIINGDGDRPMHLPMWPIAAVVIVAIVVGGLLWLFGRDSTPTQPTVVVRPGPSSTVDPVARNVAWRASAKADQLGQQMPGEIALSVAAARHTIEAGYRTRDNDNYRATHQQVRALEDRAVQELAERLAQPSELCRKDPTIPSCRHWR